MSFTASRVFFQSVADAAPKPKRRREVYARARAFFLWAGDAPPETLTRANFIRYRQSLEAERLPKDKIWFTLEDVFCCLQAYAKRNPGYRPPFSSWIEWAYASSAPPPKPAPKSRTALRPRPMEPKPERNYQCRFYAQCLTRAAHAGRGGGPLSCRDCGQCQTMTNEEWRGELSRDIYASARFLSAVFAEELGTNRQWVRAEQPQKATKETNHAPAQ